MTAHADTLLQITRQQEEGARRYWLGEPQPAGPLDYVVVGWQRAWASDPDRGVSEDGWPAARASTGLPPGQSDSDGAS